MVLHVQGLLEIDATVRREQLVKLDHLPLMQRVPSLPADLLPGARVRLQIEAIDLLGPELNVRFLNLLDDEQVAEAEDPET